MALAAECGRNPVVRAAALRMVVQNVRDVDVAHAVAASNACDQVERDVRAMTDEQWTVTVIVDDNMGRTTRNDGNEDP